jgi:hypothetical protein
MKYYIKVLIETDSLAERNKEVEKAKAAGFPVVEFGQYSRTRKAVEVFEEADEGFLSEYAEFVEAIA